MLDDMMSLPKAKSHISFADRRQKVYPNDDYVYILIMIDKYCECRFLSSFNINRFFCGSEYRILIWIFSSSLH